MREIQCDDVDESIAQFKKLGYRLDMLQPADAPREVQLSKNGETVLLVCRGKSVQRASDAGIQNGWTTGRAGMMYRDLIPDRLGGKLIASHIRLTKGGPVPDYVHYHKVEFQMIRCIRGRILVVYEDQGEPFWLEPGDWVIQPPEIRHRVLEAEADSEVIEMSIPAEHETWVDHEMTLPTKDYRPDREFSGQRFVRHVAEK
jgi:quercetin dioxygenase-like cupin family protein